MPPLRVLFYLVLCTLLPLAGLARPKIPPLTDEDFSRTASTIEPEAGAEVLARDVMIESSFDGGTRLEVFMRIRVYHERDIDDLAKFEIPFAKGERVTGVKVRTIRPDRSVVELAKGDIYERDSLRSGKRHQRVVSFAPPALAPGVIVELNWVLRDPEFSSYFVMNFAHPFPTRLVRFHLRPEVVPTYQFRTLFFNCPRQELKMDGDGYFNCEMTDVRGWKEEPYQPPIAQINPVGIIYYRSAHEAKQPAAYWADEAKDLLESYRGPAKVTPAIRSKAQELTAAATTPEARLAALHEFCRTQIVHLSLATTPYSTEERAKLPKNKSATDTLQRGHGTAQDINTLFIALARALDFDARPARFNDRTDFLITDVMMEPFILLEHGAAVRFGEEWRYYMPSASFLPPGVLPWWLTETMVLVGAPKGGALATIRFNPATDHRRVRRGDFTLDDQGTLEGTVTVSYVGAFASSLQHAFDGETAEDQRKHVEDEIEELVPRAEISDLVITGALDRAASPQITFRLRVPEYAERTGSRLFVQPGIFHRTRPPLFEKETRRSGLFFDYCYTTLDEFNLALPEGYTLEAGAAPAPVPMHGLGNYGVKLSYGKRSRRLTFQRTFSLEGLMVPLNHYEAVRQIYLAIKESDSHTLTFKRETPAPAAETTAAPANTTSAAPAGE